MRFSFLNDIVMFTTEDGSLMSETKIEPDSGLQPKGERFKLSSQVQMFTMT